jgi:hypothetical protein
MARKTQPTSNHDERYFGSAGTAHKPDGWFSDPNPTEATEVKLRDGTSKGSGQNIKWNRTDHDPNYFSHKTERAYTGTRGQPSNEAFGSSGPGSTRKLRDGESYHVDGHGHPVFWQEVTSGGSARGDWMRVRTQRGAAQPREAFDPGIASELHRYGK